jgi:hypothetical protein
MPGVITIAERDQRLGAAMHEPSTARRAFRLHLAGLSVVIASAFGSSALAAGAYSLHLSAPSPVREGHKFTVKATGSSKRTAHLYIYLDRQTCASDLFKEAGRDGVYKAGHSYFVQHAESGKVKGTWYFAVVSGKFNKSPTAHAGNAAGREHACGYLVTADKFGNFGITSAKAGASYRVKK